MRLGIGWLAFSLLFMPFAASLESAPPALHDRQRFRLELLSPPLSSGLVTQGQWLAFNVRLHAAGEVENPLVWYEVPELEKTTFLFPGEEGTYAGAFQVPLLPRDANRALPLYTVRVVAEGTLEGERYRDERAYPVRATPYVDTRFVYPSEGETVWNEKDPAALKLRIAYANGEPVRDDRLHATLSLDGKETKAALALVKPGLYYLFLPAPLPPGPHDLALSLAGAYQGKAHVSTLLKREEPLFPLLVAAAVALLGSLLALAYYLFHTRRPAAASPPGNPSQPALSAGAEKKRSTAPPPSRAASALPPPSRSSLKDLLAELEAADAALARGAIDPETYRQKLLSLREAIRRRRNAS